LVRIHSGSFWCRDKPRALGFTWTHHTPGSGVCHHHTPYSILCDASPHPHPNGTNSRDSQVGVPKFTQVSRFWTPGTLGGHNSSPRPRIATRSEPKLWPSSRSFQRRIVLPNRTSGAGRFPTFSGQELNCQFDSRPFFCS
jgi:hypothetical protein